MAKVDSSAIAAIKTYFEEGDTLSETGFYLLIEAIAEAAEDHEHVSTGGPSSGTGDASAIVNLDSGLAAAKEVTPAVGDCYVETDTDKFYVCYSAGVWTQV